MLLRTVKLISVFGISIFFYGCNLPQTQITSEDTPDPIQLDEIQLTEPALNFNFPPTRAPGEPILTPTPNPARSLPQPRTQSLSYTVQFNDTLGVIASRNGITLEALITANQITNPDLLSVGQSLVIPAPIPSDLGPSFKIIPDSELIDGPMNVNFPLDIYVRTQNGHLAKYLEDVEGQIYSGAEIVAMVADQYSVNPRLLLALLEYQSSWLTQAQARLESLSFPMGLEDPFASGLYSQLAWTANTLNRGYYLWRVNGLGYWSTTNGSLIPASPTLNAGTAAVQYFFAQLYPETEWRQVVSESGFMNTYKALFGIPFDWAVNPIIPDDLTQPTLQLPFEPGVPWLFTGGPHGGWNTGSAWAALDFSPPMEELGCHPNDAWVVAMADGVIVRSENGAVIQDLDGDDAAQTGWSLFYMHIETRDRVPVGTFLNAGERIGHPSCEGGFSSGSHVHIARLYNGEWISADGQLPFVMDGWKSEGTGEVYDGYLQKEGQSIEACECQEPTNTVER